MSDKVSMTLQQWQQLSAVTSHLINGEQKKVQCLNGPILSESVCSKCSEDVGLFKVTAALNTSSCGLMAVTKHVGHLKGQSSAKAGGGESATV